MAAAASIRSWRTAFLTLRDECPNPPPMREDHEFSIPDLLHNLIFSNSQSLIVAAPELPPHEVASDLLFLMELVLATTSQHGEDLTAIFNHISHLVHDICHRVSFQINWSSWTLILDFFGKMVEFFLGKVGAKPVPSANAAIIKPIMECLETTRHLIKLNNRKCLLSEDTQLMKFLLHVIACSHAVLVRSPHSNENQNSAVEFGRRMPGYSNLWEVQTVAFTMLGESVSRVGSSLGVDIFKSIIEVFRKVMDVLASKSLLVEDYVMSRFYASLLHCLHLVLMDPKCSLSDHVSGFVAALQMFFIYGLSSRPQFTYPDIHINERKLSLVGLNSNSEESTKTNRSPYRPPHLRKRESSNMNQLEARDSRSFSDHQSSTVDFMSSDSDYSDSDGSQKDTDNIRSSKVRVAAIVCVQDLCQADPKAFTTQWTLLLPTNDVLRPRKFEGTLMTCLLFDPYLKARIASASTLAVMLDGPSPVFLQVAEYKESTKLGSFTALSSSLGQILIQLHTGILHLIQRETNSRLLASLFKILMLLISSTPYSRLPGELLPKVLTSLRARIEEGFPYKSDQTGLVAAAVSCLTATLSTSPSSPQVKDILFGEISAGSVEAEKKSGILLKLFQYSEQLTNPTICFEALQALRAVSHNYPNIMFACWEQVSTIVYEILRVATPEVPPKPWKGNVGNTIGFIGEKVITSAIKVLDECLRAISGFKGTEDHLDDKLLDTPFTSDCIRMKKISSAPSHEPESTGDTKSEPKASQSGSKQWCEAVEKHIPLVLHHTSAVVRTASVTCFAGITSSVFFALTKDKQDFILSSLINAAVYDEAPSVRSAACRAIGVISCFPQISQSAEILNKSIHAVEINTRDPLVSVRITASWALANICDSLRHCIGDFPSKDSIDVYTYSQIMALLSECALRLTKDGDKVKSNAVRALGNLSRLVKYTSFSGDNSKPVNYTNLSFTSNSTETLPPNSDLKASRGYGSNSYHTASLGDPLWLERMVQAFLSCVTTGNVKVQWNVCHALSNLFLNETLRLQDMDWAPSVFSILLLLLRDSPNFKIRIQAAAALAVPASVLEYGKSFSDVVQGLEHSLENLGSDKISAPSSFKYKYALEKQVTSTMLHVLTLASSTDHEPLKDFLVKKASFLEEWFKRLSASLGATSTDPDVESNSFDNQKKEMISKAIQSLIEVYEGRNHPAIAQKFKKLDNSIWLMTQSSSSQV